MVTSACHRRTEFVNSISTRFDKNHVWEDYEYQIKANLFKQKLPLR